MESIYKVQRAGSSEYRTLTRAQFDRLNQTKLVLEGVDGDEESDSVTYWYARTQDGSRPTRRPRVPIPHELIADQCDWRS